MSDVDPFSPADAEGEFSITGISGGTYYVMTEAEQSYFVDVADRYLKDNHFSNVTDLLDVDRMIMNELLVWRWQNWLSQERDYWGNAIDLEGVKKAINDYSKEIRLLKKALGIDKAARDKERGESVSEYLENLRHRAREFGVHRENQLTKCITLFQELQAQITYHDNCDPEERRENDIEEHDIMRWIRQVAIPEFNAIDEHFRKNQQKFWVRTI